MRRLLLLAVACLTGFASADWVTATLPAGSDPHGVAVSPATNKIYVVTQSGNNATIIDGATMEYVTVSVGSHPHDAAVNPLTNKIYVTNEWRNSVTVIDGETNSTSAVRVGRPSLPRTTHGSLTPPESGRVWLERSR